MNLAALPGNERIRRQLSGRDGRSLGHAYILSGPAGSGRHTLANLLAAAMVCQSPETGQNRPCGQCPACRKVSGGIHPDVIRIAGARDGKPISVDQVRQMRTDAFIRPNEADRKIYLLEQAERMNPSAQNAMLKLLEEGPAYAAFLLLAENELALLPTIRSRCESLVLSPAQAGEPPDPAVQAMAQQLALALAQGDELELFRQTMPLEKLEREELRKTLEQTILELRRLLPQSKQPRRLLQAVELVRTLLGAVPLNANAGQLAGWLCAGMFAQSPI